MTMSGWKPTISLIHPSIILEREDQATSEATPCQSTSEATPDQAMCKATVESPTDPGPSQPAIHKVVSGVVSLKPRISPWRLGAQNTNFVSHGFHALHVTEKISSLLQRHYPGQLCLPGMIVKTWRKRTKDDTKRGWKRENLKVERTWDAKKQEVRQTKTEKKARTRKALRRHCEGKHAIKSETKTARYERRKHRRTTFHWAGRWFWYLCGTSLILV